MCRTRDADGRGKLAYELYADGKGLSQPKIGFVLGMDRKAVHARIKRYRQHLIDGQRENLYPDFPTSLMSTELYVAYLAERRIVAGLDISEHDSKRLAELRDLLATPLPRWPLGGVLRWCQDSLMWQKRPRTANDGDALFVK